MTDELHSTAAGRVPAVDGLRAVAALGVVSIHCWLLSGTPRSPSFPFKWFVSSWLGVDMFFVVSGFLLFLPYAAGRPLPRRDYFRRRAARLLPAYYASIAFVLVVFPFAVVQPADLPHPLTTIPGVVAVVAHLSLLHAVLLGWAFRWLGLGVDPAWWTLTLEALFYVSLPLVAVRFARRPVAWTVGAVVVAVAWRFAMFHDANWGGWIPPTTRGALNYFGDSFPGYLGHFAFGMAAAYAYVRVRPSVERARMLLIAGIVGAAASAWWSGQDYLRHDTVAFHPDGLAYTVGRSLFAAAFAMMLLGITRLPVANAVFGSGPLKWIGDRSYGVYLLHLPIAAVLYQQTSLFRAHPSAPRTYAESVVVVGALAIAAGAVSFALIERPMIRWARRRGGLVAQRRDDLEERRGDVGEAGVH